MCLEATCLCVFLGVCALTRLLGFFGTYLSQGHCDVPQCPFVKSSSHVGLFCIFCACPIRFEMCATKEFICRVWMGKSSVGT